MVCEQSGKVPCPFSKLGCLHPHGIVHRIFEYTKYFVGEKLSDWTGHACETLHKKIDRVVAVEVERRTGRGSVCPWVMMVEHVDEDDTE